MSGVQTMKSIKIINNDELLHIYDPTDPRSKKLTLSMHWLPIRPSSPKQENVP